MTLPATVKAPAVNAGPVLSYPARW
jgi:hypothetical protein